ncbi:MAG: hypothetical protein ACOYL5_18840 [Phototrophicaceae bacterium]
MTDDDFLPDSDLAELDEQEPEWIETSVHPSLILPSARPLFQTLFVQAASGDPVLTDFAEQVVGELSDRFALKAAKGGAFFEARKAEGLKNSARYQNDQTLRAHLINGMLPSLQTARLLARWGGRHLTDWDDTHERLFIAGYMLHDYTKIEAVQETLRARGFKVWEAPSERQIPVLEEIFQGWCSLLGLDAFLEPIGGTARYLHDLIYIACNTQQMKGTLHATALLPNQKLDVDQSNVITDVSYLADLIAVTTQPEWARNKI